ncbi:MAG: hypothetical protein AAF203_09970, partial [Pseudomonadota bacterium]
MKKVWLASYQLDFVGGGSRKGYLLKVQTQDFEAGYADIFPWPEFGDDSFTEIPQKIKRESLSPLLQKSFLFAEKDGRARQEGQSLYLQKPLNNHYLLGLSEPVDSSQVSAIRERGFDTVKIKLSGDFSRAMGWVRECASQGLRLRLDFNRRGSREQLDHLAELAPSIDFIEDPFERSESWLEIEKSSPELWKKLAFDHPGFAYNKVKTNWQVIKPAKQSHLSVQASQIVYTSYLDHPVGMIHGMIEASDSGTDF